MEDIIEDGVENVKEKTNAIEPVESKSLTDVNIGDIKFNLDHTKSFEEQAEDVVGAMATAKAVSDETTAKDLADKKAQELREKASQKLKTAQTENIKAETHKQEAEREKNEAVLQTFGINKHLPDWLLKIMVVLFSPIYVLLTIVIGIPCGIVKVLIDNIDNILVRYENAKESNRPKIKITVWIVLVLLVLSGIALAVLKGIGKI